jgi:hypothetical protein
VTKTIIYLSSNQENPEFERKIQEDLLSKCGNIPIISVTQKPIDFGLNICVGDVGASGFNFCRQVQIACKNATTDYVIHAEADCLYSPDYFTIQPERLDVCYRNSNVYVQKFKQDFACKKEGSTFSSMVGREFYLKRLEELFKGMPEWSVEMKNFPKEIGKKFFDHYEYYQTQYPCISFKTGRGMRKHSPSDEVPVYDLPYWGSIEELRGKYGIK